MNFREGGGLKVVTIDTKRLLQTKVRQGESVPTALTCHNRVGLGFFSMVHPKANLSFFHETRDTKRGGRGCKRDGQNRKTNLKVEPTKIEMKEHHCLDFGE